MFKAVRKLSAFMSYAVASVAGVFIVVMLLHIVADVAAKFLFHHPLTGTLEIVSNYYMVGAIFLPLAMVQLRRNHLRVDAFTNGLPPRAKAGMDAGVNLLGFAYVVVLTVLVFNSAVEATARGEMRDVTFFDLPVWPARWILPIAFACMAIVLFFQMLGDLSFAVTGNRNAMSEPEDDSSLDHLDMAA